MIKTDPKNYCPYSAIRNEAYFVGANYFKFFDNFINLRICRKK